MRKNPFRTCMFCAVLLLIAGIIATCDYAWAGNIFNICSNNNVLTNPEYMPRIIESGAKMCRIDMSFANIRRNPNPDPDHWDWTLFNAVRVVSKQYPRASFLAILGYGTSWAADPKFAGVSGTINCPQRGINVMPPWCPENLYGNYVFETVKRYKDCIYNWESWNEPDLPGHNFFKGSGADFLPYQRACYLAAKQADPTCKVIFAGQTFANVEGYLFAHQLKPPSTAPVHSSFFEEYLQAVLKDPNAKANNYYFDAMNQHSYSRATDLWDYTAVDKKLMRDYLGQEKPIWFTETGFVDKGGAWGGTAEEYCDYIWQSFCWAERAGVQRNFHFQLDNSNGHGLWSGMLGQPKPALQVYKILAHEFDDIGFVAQLHGRSGVGFLEGNSPYVPSWTTGYNSFEFRSTDGKRRFLVAFSDTSKPVDITLPAKKDSAVLIDRFGNRRTILARNGIYALHLAGATNLAGFPILQDSKAKAMGQPEHLVGGATQIIVE